MANAFPHSGKMVGMRLPRFQITLPHALGAVVWLALWIGSWFAGRLEGPDEHFLMPFAFFILFLMFGGPFAAVGTLLGYPGWGILLGLLALVVAFAILSVLIPF